MSAHSLILLDLQETLNSLFSNLFTVQTAIYSLVAAVILALLGLGIAFFFLKPKVVCSWLCSVHWLTVAATIVLGLLGAFALADHFKLSLIIGAGIGLLILTPLLFLLVESFGYVVLSNK